MKTSFLNWRVFASVALVVLAAGALTTGVQESLAGKLAESSSGERNGFLLSQFVIPVAMLIVAWRLFPQRVAA